MISKDELAKILATLESQEEAIKVMTAFVELMRLMQEAKPIIGDLFKIAKDANELLRDLQMAYWDDLRDQDMRTGSESLNRRIYDLREALKPFVDEGSNETQ